MILNIHVIVNTELQRKVASFLTCGSIKLLKGISGIPDGLALVVGNNGHQKLKFQHD